jgi:uncharacterized membrane protein YbaN (DUF454 family)
MTMLLVTLGLLFAPILAYTSFFLYSFFQHIENVDSFDDRE